MLPTFNFTDDILTIDTDNMELRLDRGVVVYIKSHITDEVLLNTAYSMPASPWNWNGYAVSGGGRLPGADNTPTQIDDYNYQVVYDPCYDSGGTPVTGAEIVYDINVDSVTGEISVSIRCTDPLDAPTQVTFPLMNFTGDILYDLHKITNSDANISDWQTWGDHSTPPCVAIIGTSDCAGVWSENTKFLRELTLVDHVQNVNTALRMRMPIDATQYAANPLRAYAGPYVFSCQPHWTEVARRWRTRFTSETGFAAGYAKYLWNKNPSWVRNVHCLYRGTDYDNLAELATSIDNPERIMVMTYNGMSQVLYGDNTHYFTSAAAISGDCAGNVAAVRTSLGNANALPVVGYHSWFRALSFAGTDSAETYVTRDTLPPGYTYPTSFVAQTHLGDIDSTAWETLWAGKWISELTSNPPYRIYYIHPGWDDFRNYMIANCADMRSRLNLLGSILDVGGTQDYSNSLTGDFRNGYSFLDGIIKMLQDLYEIHPLGGEYIGYTWMPYLFFTWEGFFQYGYHPAATHDTDRIIDHPWRNALLGGLFWMHGHVIGKGANYDYEAYFGALPQTCISTDGSDVQGSYGYQTSQLRAKMFCDYELYYDLPTGYWEDGVLAYFRSNTGNYFKEIKRATGRYAYLEMHPNGDYTRLQWEEQTAVSASTNQTLNFADTYNSVPTIALNVNSGSVTVGAVTETQVTFNVSGESDFDWMVIGSDETELPSFYSRGVYENLPETDDDLAIPYTIDDIADVATDDTDMVAQLATSQIAIHQFKQQIDGTGGIINTVAQVTIPCSTSTAYLQIYNRSGTPAWDTIDSDNATGANTDFTLSATVADLTDYKDENNIVACRVYQEMQ